MSKVKVKILTIHSFSQYRNIHGEYVPNPCIRLQGKWLARLGFNPADKVEIKAKEGVLLVKLIKE